MTKKDTLLKLKEKERELRRSIIIKAAREVFSKKTYDKASMAEIARAAGISKSSIYTYFNSQEELYAQIACRDVCVFIGQLKQQAEALKGDVVRTAIDKFLSYYVENQSQWKMITHFALHGNKDMKSVGRLNDMGRQLMDLFEMILARAGCVKNTRLMAHTLFASLSGVLIAFRNYPGRTEKERIAHIKKVGGQLGEMMNVFIKANQSGGSR